MVPTGAISVKGNSDNFLNSSSEFCLALNLLLYILPAIAIIGNSISFVAAI
jgi:hypothetical protein